MFTKIKTLALIDKITWLGAIVIVFIIVVASLFVHRSQVEKLAFVQTRHCEEQKTAQLELLSKFNDDYLTLARTLRNSPSQNSNISEILDNTSVKNVVYLKSHLNETYSLKQLWSRDQPGINSHSPSRSTYTLLPWMQRKLKNSWITHPEYLVDSSLNSLFVIAPTSRAPGNKSDLVLFELNKDQIKKPFGKSETCPLSIWNHTGDTILSQFDANAFELLGKTQTQKGQVWVKGESGDDLIVYEQHPSRVIIAHKISFQEIYRRQKQSYKDTLLLIGLSLFSWGLLSIYLRNSFSGPIERFIDVLQRISRGDFKASPRLFLKGDMGRLERTISETAERLREDFGEQQNEGLRLVEDVFEGDEVKKIIVLTCRIQSQFSTLTSRTAQQGVEQANVVYDIISKHVSKNHGTAYNIKGDTIYSVWPVKKTNDAISHSLMTALGIRKELGRLNSSRAEEGHKPVLLRIGIDTSHGYVGLIGPSNLRLRRVIGPSEQTSETLSHECEKLGFDILISEDIEKLSSKYFKSEAVSSISSVNSKSEINACRLIGYYDAQLKLVEVTTPYSEQ